MKQEHSVGEMAPSGALAMSVERDLGVLTMRSPARAWRLHNWLRNRWSQDLKLTVFRFFGRITGHVWLESRLYLKVLHADGTFTDLGLVGRKVVTTVGVGFIVDAFQGLVEPEDMKFHGFGTGTTGENVADTDIETELTTQYASDNVRPTGTTTEGASANIYRTVATLSPDSGGTIAVTEHGVLSDAAVGSGVLLDRTVFAAVNIVASQDSLQATYELTLTAGS